MKLIMRSSTWPWRRPAVLAAFVSHKVLRLGLPFLMIGGGIANLLLVALYPAHWAFVATLAVQAAAFLLAAAGYVADRTNRRWKIAHLAFHLVQSNLTVLGGLADILRGQQFTIWKKPAR